MKDKAPYIVGIGPGDQRFLYPLAQEVIEEATLLIGGRRQLDIFAHLPQEALEIGDNLAAVAQKIAATWQQQRIVILASGDTGLFSIAQYLQKKLPEVPFKLLPGVSALQYLCAKLGLAWDDMAILSLHGKECHHLRRRVLNQRYTAIFTGGGHSPVAVASQLRNMEGLRFYVGENLSYANERIVKGDYRQICAETFDPLSLMIVENPLPGAGPWPYRSAGIADELFIRGEVPMTKSEARSVVLAKLRLREDDLVLDIGAGTGSVAVEMALQLPRGRVWAIEKNPEGASLCRQNAEKFLLDNISVIEGEAPAAIPAIPGLSRVFIGGGGGALAEIIDSLGDQALRVVIAAITVETVSESLAILSKYGFEHIEALQVTVARSKQAGDKHMMMGMNPTFIIAGERS